MNIPIISLEVQGMKDVIKTALLEHSALMDSAIRKAVDNYCTEENINAVVREEAMRQLDMAVKEEVKNFFGWSGGGRTAVREAVIEYLDQIYPAAS